MSNFSFMFQKQIYIIFFILDSIKTTPLVLSITLSPFIYADGSEGSFKIDQK